MAKYGLMLCEREEIADQFYLAGLIDDSSLYEYTPDGVYFYPSFLEAIQAAVTMGGVHAIGMRAKEDIPVIEH